MAKVQHYIEEFNKWREEHISQQQFVFFLSIIIGLITGVAAYLMKTFVIYLKDVLVNRFEVDQNNLLLYAYPMIGILLTVLFLRWIIRDNVRHGIPRILYVISKKKGEMRKHKTFSSFIGGALTSGFGGSAGLESPIISTGASIGSTFASTFNLNYKTKSLLIGCGAAGAMASIFTTPIAAVIFSMEVLMLDLTATSIIPLLISSVMGAITAKLMMSDEVLFHFSLDNHFIISDLPYYIVLGILAGLVSLYFNRTNYLISKWMNQITKPRNRTLVGMLLMGLLIFIFPVLFGEGYNFLKIIINGDPKDLTSWSFFYDYRMNFWIFSGFLLLVLLLKGRHHTHHRKWGNWWSICPSGFYGRYHGLFGFELYQSLWLGTTSQREIVYASWNGSGIRSCAPCATYRYFLCRRNYQWLSPYASFDAYHKHRIFHYQNI